MEIVMKNREVAEMFFNVADMLAIRGDNIHRILAYRRGAESLEGLGRDVNQVYAEGKLTDIPGVGKTLAEKIEEMLTTGRLEFYECLSREIPPTLVDMLRIEGLGPKRVKQIYDHLGVMTIADLQVAAKAGKLRELPKMGAKTEAKLIKAIDMLARHGDDRIPLGDAWPLAQEILGALAQLPGVEKTAVAGSLRRCREMIGDIDLLVTATESAHIMDAFVNLPQVESVSGRGLTKSSVILLNGMQVDLRVLPPERWGTLLSYFTGSKNHNVRLRELALKQGLRLSEYAFAPEDGTPEIVCDTEEAVYETLGLPYILPTLREDLGEIEAAQNGRLPQLIQLEDIVGDLHMHTTWSDGQLSVLEMAQLAQEQGLQYIAITDHSVSLGIANGLSEERLWQLVDDVQNVNDQMGPDFHVLYGTEMEIKADGSLDYEDYVLEELDFVIASLHTSLSQPRQQITERLLKAIHHPHVDMIAHPTGRLLPDRPGADLDMDLILETAVATGTILEINANPRRLDLRDSHVRRAVEVGVKIAINTDAHRPEHFAFRHFGVSVGQRGWLPAEQVVNTWPIEKFLAYLQEGKSRD